MRKVSGRRTAIDLDNLVRRSGARLQSAAVKASISTCRHLDRGRLLGSGAGLPLALAGQRSPLWECPTAVENEGGLFRNSAKLLAAIADCRPASMDVGVDIMGWAPVRLGQIEKVLATLPPLVDPERTDGLDTGRVLEPSGRTRAESPHKYGRS